MTSIAVFLLTRSLICRENQQIDYFITIHKFDRTLS